MNFGKMEGKGNPKRKPQGKAADTVSGQGAAQPGQDASWGTIDARPAPDGGKSAFSLDDVQAWKDSKSGLRNLWGNYIQLLSNSFKAMPRYEQESLINRISLIVTIGVAVIVTSIFYSFLPALIRIMLVPMALAAGYYIGARIVGPVMIARYEKYLNRE